MQQQINEQIRQLLLKNNITLGAVHLGKTTRDKWECFSWEISLSGPKKTETFNYFTGLGHVNKLESNVIALLKSAFGGGFTDKDEQTNSTYWRSFQQWLKSNNYVKPLAPAPADFLHSVICDGQADVSNFPDWCDEYGYSTDSRKALDTYLSCQENSKKLRLVLGAELVAEIAEALQDY
jgi:hypothetical protein